MSLDARYSRRTFLGLAAGVPVAATVTGCSGPSRPGAQQPSPHLRPRASRRLVSENALPGGPVSKHHREDSDQERGGDLAGLPHLGYRRSEPLPRRCRKLKGTLCQPGRCG